jgi:hypothetical protein
MKKCDELRPRSFPGMTNHPVEVIRHPEYGIVEVYAFMSSTNSGAFSSFDNNGARPHHLDHFGLKWCSCEQRMKEAWTAQKIAAKLGLAPPVGRVIKTYYGYWGYQTGVAVIVKDVEPQASTFYPGTKSTAKKLAVLQDELSVLPDVGRWQDDLHMHNVAHYRGRLVCIDFT